MALLLMDQNQTAMKNVIITLVAIFMIGLAAVNAQEPTPLSDTVKDPVKQGDPEVKNQPLNINYLNGMVKITPKELPAPVKQTLEAGSQYQGWERASLYKNKAGDSFIVEMKEGDRTKIFRFDKTGKPVLD
jgi:hypothetical protein